MRRAVFVLLGLATAVGCNGSGDGKPSPTQGVLQDVQSIIFVQRPSTGETGNVFDYTAYHPGGRLVKLEPPSADGKLTVLTAGPMWEGADVMAWDLSFDAKQVVFSARLKSDNHFHLYVMNVDGTGLRALTSGPYHYVFPVFLPGQKVLFTTTKVVEEGAKQFADEYERQTTSQVGVINLDGAGEVLGPRNVSHRVSPTLMPDGQVLYTEWRHLGPINDGHLRYMNQDMTGMREAFGGEGKGVTNSYLKARYVETTKGADGRDNYTVVAVATSRDRTLQAGKLILVELGAAEKLAKVTDLTPLVPGGNTPSSPGVGRYYDAEIVGNPADRKFLVSWADGLVQSELLEEAKTKANFGIYVYDAKTGTRQPVWDDPAYWDVMARPVKPRPEPPVTQSPVAGGAGFVVGALDVYKSTVATLERGTVVKVRLLEGFSGEEGFSMFGTTEFDGQSRYGEVPVYADGSFAARIPANVPVHMQLIDKFAMSVVSEDIWISGRDGEQRFCGGCHESRSDVSVIQPGSTEAMQRGPIDLNVARKERVSMDFSYDKIRGVPWKEAIQPIFDAKCVSCHDGDPAKPGNPSYTVVDMTLGTMQTFVFDLRGQTLPIVVGERPYSEYSASYISLMGLGEMLGENNVQIVGDYKEFVEPGSAMKSDVVKKLNPMQRFPEINEAVRAFPGEPHGGLTPDEMYRLILNIDSGGQFYFRESKRGGPDVVYMP